MAEPTVLKNFRLAEADVMRLQRMVSEGLAPNETEAMRLALRAFPFGWMLGFKQEVIELRKYVKYCDHELEKFILQLDRVYPVPFHDKRILSDRPDRRSNRSRKTLIRSDAKK